MKKKITFEKASKIAEHIPVFMDSSERQVLFEEAAKLAPGEVIVEVGCLYGGSTAMLGLGSKNECPIIVYDNFSWTPDGFPTATKELALSNLEQVGLTEVTIHVADTLEIGYPTEPIGLLFIDGGHSIQYIVNDLKKFGPQARTILCHDYGNVYWTTIKQAVTEFIHDHQDTYYLEKVVGMVAVIQQIPF
jgi:precorrin-6B methylase 2